MNSEVRILAQQLLHAGIDQLPERDRRVIARVARRLHIRNVNQVFEQRLTLGERLADRVAAVGGSWAFIAGFGVFLCAWAFLNGVLFARHAIDPYPFIFLNLMLSMLAAVQAPVIMMSQNRQDTKDRLRSELDFDVNRRAESEIQALSRKLALLTDKVGDVEDLLRAGISQKS
jgi:uncharacterized membrane protein